jgi:uncharacterized protein (TIGR02246 family)
MNNRQWDAIQKANQEWMAAYSREDLDGLVDLYTQDSLSLAPNETPYRGRNAIRELWAQALASPMKALELHSDEVQAIGELAYEIGHSIQRDANGEQIGRFHYLVIWQQIDHAWRIHREIWNHAPASARAPE